MIYFFSSYREQINIIIKHDIFILYLCNIAIKFLRLYDYGILLRNTLLINKKIEYIPCACGFCGEYLPKYDNNGRIRKYINGHNSFKTLRCKSTAGYILIYKPDHPKCNKDGYIFEHRLVWEQHHNVCLLPHIEIHHINDKHYDNRIENLEALTKREHRIKHRKDFKNRICLLCGTRKSDYLKRRKWYNYKDGHICHNCYNKLLYMSK